MKLLQLNIFQGKYLDEIVRYVKDNDIDILCIQESTGGRWSHGGINYYPDGTKATLGANESSVNMDCFSELKTKLGYQGEINKFIGLKNDPSSYQGNAILFKNLRLVQKNEIFMLPYQEYEKVEDTRADTQPRGALNLTFEIDGKKFNIITAHMAWGPTAEDKEYKIEQAQRLYSAVELVDNPLILTGDFNVTPDTKTSSMFGALGRNLTLEFGITNTLNERTHAVKALFPRGLAVDYIFTSPQIKVNSFRVVDEVDLSDHFGLLLEFEV